MDVSPATTDPVQRLALETAHELGNIVVAMRGFVRLLGSDLERGGGGAELLSRIHDCVEALGATTGRLQEVGRGTLAAEDFRPRRA